MVQAVAHFSNAATAAAWAAWQEFRAQHQLDLAQLGKALGRFRNAALATAVSAWKDFTAVQIAKKIRMARAIGHFQDSRAAAAWGTWREAADRGVERTVKLQAAMARLTQRGLWAAWAALKEHAAWPSRKRRILEASLRQLRHRSDAAQLYIYTLPAFCFARYQSGDIAIGRACKLELANYAFKMGTNAQVSGCNEMLQEGMCLTAHRAAPANSLFPAVAGSCLQRGRRGKGARQGMQN